MKLAVIGVGNRIAGMVGMFKKACPALKVVGAIDPNEDKARERLPEDSRSDVKFFKTVPDLIQGARPDAVAVGTRCDLHTPYAIQLAPFGLPLYLEKPVANSMEQALELEKAYAKAKGQVVVSFPLRVSPLATRTRDLIEQGAVGRVEHVLAHNYVPYGSVYFDSWYRDYAVTGGLFLQKATHDFDYLDFLVGAPIVRVAAMMTRGRVFRDAATKGASPDPNSAYYEKAGTPETGMNEDHSSALIEFADGAKGVYTQVFFVKRKAGARGARVSGLKGTVAFDWYKNEVTRNWHDQPFDEVHKADHGDGHGGGDTVLAENFRDVVTAGAKSLTPIDAGLRSVFACLAARESALSGRFVDVHRV
jgi:predicted dehydrogenase